jgi:diphosphomevalonate decarboxylase
MNQIIAAEAPSNIALIKYMGKTDAANNRPSNPSLSYTLGHLRTRVEAQAVDASVDSWQPLNDEAWAAPDLSKKSVDRFINFFKVLKGELAIDGHFVLRSANNFASDCGLASSASSFAALTMLAGELYAKQTGKTLTVDRLSELSRRGSGSSCRSFFDTWSIWDDYGAVSAELPFKNLLHQVVMVESGKKEVSSSEAHLRVTTSLNFAGRTERAKDRLVALVEAMQSKDWQASFEIVWAEFWDMHSLFETSQPSFGYMNAKTFDVLEKVKDFWKANGDGPICTMDAGPNVHLLWRDDQLKQLKQMQELLSNFKVVKS